MKKVNRALALELFDLFHKPTGHQIDKQFKMLYEDTFKPVNLQKNRILYTVFSTIRSELYKKK